MSWVLPIQDPMLVDLAKAGVEITTCVGSSSRREAVRRKDDRRRISSQGILTASKRSRPLRRDNATAVVG